MGDIQFNGTPEEWDALVKRNKLIMAQQTAVDWLEEQIKVACKVNDMFSPIPQSTIEQAKQIEKKHMIDFAEFVATHPDKNKNYLGEMLHAKSKYDGAERTVDLLEQYYNETFKNQ